MFQFLLRPEVLGIGLFILMCAAVEVGALLGRRRTAPEESFTSHLLVIRGTTLALLSFLVAFSFSGAASRYIDRMDLIVKEANAIGTAYLRAMILPEPQRADLQTLLRQYSTDRVAFFRTTNVDEMRPLLVRAGEIHTKIWDTALKGIAGNTQLMLVILPSLNDVIDIHSEHLSASRRHTPTMVMAFLVAFAVFGSGLIGFGNGLNQRRHRSLDLLYCVVMAATFWMTFDLDRLRFGFIQVSPLPYVELLETMGK